MFVKIYDNEDNLIGIHLTEEAINEGKNFLTKPEMTLQLGAFYLKKDSKITNHFHNEYDRNVKVTGEELVVLEGELKVDFYDKDLNFLKNVIVKKHETILMFGGGHGIEVSKDTKFIEIKQGPFNEELDKERF